MCWRERRGRPALSYQASPRSETHTCKVHQFLIVCGSLIWNAPSPSRSLEILNSTGLEIVGPRHSIQVKLIQINNLRRLDFLSQFQHLGNRNTFWRHRLDSLLRTGNRAYSSLNFCVGHTVLKSSLSGASISQLGRNRTILHYVWPWCRVLVLNLFNRQLMVIKSNLNKLPWSDTGVFLRLACDISA